MAVLQLDFFRTLILIIEDLRGMHYTVDELDCTSESNTMSMAVLAGGCTLIGTLSEPFSCAICPKVEQVANDHENSMILKILGMKKTVSRSSYAQNTVPLEFLDHLNNLLWH